MEVYTGSRDQWTAFLVERCFILHIDGGGSRLHGVVETQRPMRGDGFAQEEDVVWRHGGVDGREAWQSRCISFFSKEGLMEDGGDDTKSVSDQLVSQT